jgi:chromosome segregation ATPase
VLQLQKAKEEFTTASLKAQEWDLAQQAAEAAAVSAQKTRAAQAEAVADRAMLHQQLLQVQQEVTQARQEIASKDGQLEMVAEAEEQVREKTQLRNVQITELEQEVHRLQRKKREWKEDAEAAEARLKRQVMAAEEGKAATVNTQTSARRKAEEERKEMQRLKEAAEQAQAALKADVEKLNEDLRHRGADLDTLERRAQEESGRAEMERSRLAEERDGLTRRLAELQTGTVAHEERLAAEQKQLREAALQSAKQHDKTISAQQREYLQLHAAATSDKERLETAERKAQQSAVQNRELRQQLEGQEQQRLVLETRAAGRAAESATVERDQRMEIANQATMLEKKNQQLQQQAGDSRELELRYQTLIAERQEVVAEMAAVESSLKRNAGRELEVATADAAAQATKVAETHKWQNRQLVEAHAKQMAAVESAAAEAQKKAGQQVEQQQKGLFEAEALYGSLDKALAEARTELAESTRRADASEVRSEAATEQLRQTERSADDSRNSLLRELKEARATIASQALTLDTQLSHVEAVRKEERDSSERAMKLEGRVERLQSQLVNLTDSRSQLVEATNSKLAVSAAETKQKEDAAAQLSKQLDRVSAEAAEAAAAIAHADEAARTRGLEVQAVCPIGATSSRA